jgi:hypothetical protein
MRNAKVTEYLKVKGRINTYDFLDHVNLHPHDGQRRIIDAYQEKVPASPEAKALGLDFEYRYRTFIAACGRRFGKSTIVGGLGAEEMLYPYANVLIYSGFKENTKVIYREIRDLVRKMGLEVAIDRNKELELELANGARLCVASNETIESRLGNNVSLLILDEAKLCRRDLYETYLAPQLLDYAPLSRTIMISSPQEGWLQDYYERGQSNDPRFADVWSLSLPTSSNPTISKKELLRIQEVTPPDVWEQEYEGKFVSTAGKVVKEFNRDTCLFTEEDFPNFWRWVSSSAYASFHSIDSGYTHFFAGIYGLFSEELDTLFLFGEYMLNRAVTSVHADNIKAYELQRLFEPSLRFADPAASQQIADLAEHGLGYNKSTKNTRETVNTLNSMFYQTSKVTGRPRLLVHHECFELIRQLTEVRWKTDQADQAREASASGVKPFVNDTNRKTDWDLFDACRYGVYSYVKNGRIGVFILDEALEELDDEEADFDKSMIMQGWVRTS